MIQAISWALGQAINRSTAKFVLVVLANYANDKAMAFPSIRTLCNDTAQDAKTVGKNLKVLTDLGLIKDSGHRVGKTKQIPVYQLLLDVKLKITEIGGVLSTPEIRAKDPVSDVEHPRFSVETPPKTVYGTIRDPSLNHQGSGTKSGLRTVGSGASTGDLPKHEQTQALLEWADNPDVLAKYRDIDDLIAHVPMPLRWRGYHQWLKDRSPGKPRNTPAAVVESASSP